MVKRNVKILAAAAILVSLGAGFSSVSAAGFSNGSTAKNTVCYAGKGLGKGKGENFIKTKFDALVKAGTITQAQETDALKIFTPDQTKGKGPGNFIKTKLDTLVTAGTITQVQETEMLNSLTK